MKLGKQVSYFFSHASKSFSLPLRVCVGIPTYLCLPKGWGTDNCFYVTMNSTTPRSVLRIYYNIYKLWKEIFFS